MISDPSFERDIFISYAHLDNEALTEEEKGWISKFDAALHKRLGQLLGREPDIWRDRKLQGNDIFGDEIVAQFPKLKVLVSIISPRYVKSEWCLRELHEFYKAAEEQGGVRVGNKSRVFKVIKTPVPKGEHPPEIQSVLGYEFYREDETGHFREFDLAKNSPTYFQFLRKFDDLAQDLCDLLKVLDKGAQPGEDAGGNGEDVSPAKTVYLADTTRELRDDRDAIRRELIAQDYLVLPNQELPIDSRLRPTVQDYLRRCKLAVHPIGRKYGLVPEDEQKSLLEVQQELSQQADLIRLIWLGRGTHTDDPRQQRFLDELQNQAVAEPGTELLTDNVEVVKTEIINTLRKLATQAETESETHAAEQRDNKLKRIYLIFDKVDEDAATELDVYLDRQGFDVLTPVFHGDESDIRELHQDKLRLCDGVLIYHNHSGEAWLDFKMNDLRKARGYRAGKPFEASAVYIAGESTPFKQRVRMREALVIKQFDGFSADDLKPFIEALQRGQGGVP